MTEQPINITFDPENHQYRYKARRIPSVTGITGNLSKDALPYWAANEGARAASELLDEWQIGSSREILTSHQRSALIDAIRRAHTDRKNTAAAKGNAVHEAIEKYHTDFFEATPPTDSEQAAAWDAFITWWRESPYRCVATEVMINGYDGRYSGRFDLLIDDQTTDQRFVCDLKTGNGTYEDHLLQLAGYAGALEHAGDHIEGTKIIWLPSGCERAVVISRDRIEWQQDLIVFLNLLTVHEWRKPNAKFMQQICKLYHPKNQTKNDESE